MSPSCKVALAIATVITTFAIIDTAVDVAGRHLVNGDAVWVAVLIAWGFFIDLRHRDAMRNELCKEINNACADVRRRLDKYEAAGLLWSVGIAPRNEGLATVHDITSLTTTVEMAVPRFAHEMETKADG